MWMRNNVVFLWNSVLDGDQKTVLKERDGEREKATGEKVIGLFGNILKIFFADKLI